MVKRNHKQFHEYLTLKGSWTPKLTYTFYPFSWKCRIFW